MHDLRLVGVHDDGEHLVLRDADGQRYLLAVDEPLRAAVRRDRAALGQLQIEMAGALRPRDVQARIRAGATAEEVASSGGWPVEKVQRYEGPVLAERAHVAGLARGVRLRRRGLEQVTLGSEVARRLAGRGVDTDHVTWDSWRTDDGPWTVVVTFSAGGRERQARWHFDLGARTVTPADDEARWLSEQAPEGEGPLGGVRLAAVPAGSVYDIEADGGVDGPLLEPERTTGLAGAEHPLDLMSAMRSRRREREHRPSSVRRGATEDAGSRPTDVPGATHPARRRRRPAAEPLELDPTLLADPPAAHPPTSLLPELGLPADEPEAPSVSEPVTELSADLPADPLAATPARHWPLADRMPDGLTPAVLGSQEQDAPAAPEVDAKVDAKVDDEADGGIDEADGGIDMIDDAGASGRHRGARSRAKRASVPSWDDIMFGAKKD